MPALGTCAGMILLADAILDGRPDQRRSAAIDIDVRRNAFGRQIDSFEADLAGRRARRGRCTPCSSGRRWSSGSGAGVEVLATVDGRPVCCRQGAVMVASFHPELSDDLRLHELFLRHVPTRTLTAT